MKQIRKILAILLMLQLALPVQVFAGTPDKSLNQVDRVMDLTTKPFGDLFRTINEDSSFDEATLQKVRELLMNEQAKEAAPIEKEKTELKNRIEAIRAERKVLNKELSSQVVIYDRLTRERDTKKSKGESTADSDKKIAEFEKQFEVSREKSRSLKREIDGDTNFDYKKAWLHLREMERALESVRGDNIDTKSMEKEMADLKAEMDAAKGLKHKVWDAELNSLLLEVKYSHRFSKLGMISRWPKKVHEINETILAGNQEKRKFGNVEDMGNLKKRKTDNTKTAKILPGLVSKNAEIQMGRQGAEEYIKMVKLYPPNSPVSEYVNRLGQNLVRNSDYWCPFTFYVVADAPGKEEINAFAMPGGQVFIHDTLILTLRSDAELAAVLAHEINHVNARHAAKMISKGQYIQFALMAMIFTGALPMYGPLAQLVWTGIDFGMNIAALGITRASESEADLLGAQVLWNAGYDPRAEIEAFDAISKEEKTSGLSFWKTHPSLDDRMERVEEEARYLPPKEQYITDTGEYAKVKKLVWSERDVFTKQLKQKETDENAPKLNWPNDSDEPEPPVLKKQTPDPNTDDKDKQEDKKPETNNKIF